MFYHSNKTVTNTVSVQRTEVHKNPKAAKSRPDRPQVSSRLHEGSALEAPVTPLDFLLRAREEELVAEQCSVIISLF